MFVKLSLVVSEISCIIRSKSKTFEVIRMRKLGKLLFQRVVLVALFILLQLAVMLVTSCVIPVLVLVFFVWLVKVIIGVDIEFPGKKTKTLEP